MAIVAGVDFGTLSVRVSIFDSERKEGEPARLATASVEYPLHRKREDPEYATQSHTDQMQSLIQACHQAIATAGISGQSIAAIALDTTGSSVVPVDARMQPLGEYYLWCGGVYSHEWGFAKVLHWLRHNPEKRAQFASAFEHCDMVAATLAGVTDPSKVVRSVCALGHKWMWNERWGGFPSQEFLSSVDPLLDGVRGKLQSPVKASDHLAGHLSPHWAELLG